jgi:tetratricopeptide (TPR) repeat protein
MKLRVIIMVTLLLGGACAEGALESYLEGYTHLTNEDYSSAIASFEKALEKDPEMTHAHAGIALAYAYSYQQTGDERLRHLAIAATEDARESDPYAYDLPELHRALAIIYTADGQEGMAELEYDTLHEIFPGFYPENMGHGDIEIMLGVDVGGSDALQHPLDIEAGHDATISALVILAVAAVIIALALVKYRGDKMASTKPSSGQAFCPVCGSSLSSGASFCSKCGSKPYPDS